MRCIGIDIGRYSIKVVEILAANRNFEITNAKEYKVLNMESSDQEIEILQTLDKISKEFDTETAKVVCSVRQQYVSTRKLFFPFKERMKIQKSLAFELEDDIPLSIDKAIYDSKVIRFHEKAAEVIAMACVTEEIVKTINIFERGHIDPDIITPEFCAVSNLYEDWRKSPDEVKESDENEEVTVSHEPDRLIVHIGHSKSFVGVVSRGSLVWGRSVMWGAEKVAAAISQNFQVPFTTANEMMPEKAFVLLTKNGANKDQIKMSDAIAGSMEPLVQSLRLTIMLANTEYGANIESVDIIGGPSHIKNLSGFFTQELEIPCNSDNPLSRLGRFGLINAEKLNESFQMALGLAIEGLRRPVNPAINFRQMELAKKNQSFEKFVEKWGYTAKILTAAYFCYFVYGVAIDSLSTQLEEASSDVLTNQAAKIANLKGRSATQSRIKSYIRRNNKKAKLVEVYDKLEEINSPMKFINEISQVLPSNKKDNSYEVRKLTVKDTVVNIQGVADSDKTITQLNKALKGIALNGKVTPVKANIGNEDNKKRFAFKFSVARKN